MLTDAKIRKLKPKAKAYKEVDTNGLYISTSPKGKKVFRYDYQHPQTKKRQTLTIGEYPIIGLQKARNLRDDAKTLLASGIDPSRHKKQQQTEQLRRLAEEAKQSQLMTLEDLYQEYCTFKTTSFGGNKPAWQANTLKKHNERFNNFVFPNYGALAVQDITENELEACLLAIQDHGTLVNLTKVKTVFNGMFDYAKGKRYIKRNVAKYITASIFAVHKSTPYKHLTSPKDIKQLMINLDGLRGTYEVKQCLKFLLYVFCRPNEASSLLWREVDLKNKIINKETSKMGKPFVIPLGRQVIAILEDMHPLTGHTGYVFYSNSGTGKPISIESLSSALRKNGINNINPHGFRHTASTALNNQGFNADVIELQLSHTIGGVRGVYNKAEKLEARAKMMQAWADYLDGLKVGDNLIQFKKNG